MTPKRLRARCAALALALLGFVSSTALAADEPERPNKGPQTRDSRDAAIGSAHAGIKSAAGERGQNHRFPVVSGPALLITQPMDAETEATWLDDMNVMDRLLRDAIQRTGSEGAPTAMGIKLTTIGRLTPMYLEGCGVVFSEMVSWPLAAAGPDAGGSRERQGDAASAWERARRELNGTGRGTAGSKGAPPPPFDQAKVDQLIDSIVKALREATNMRQLKENEYVFVTVLGMDDSGAAVRLTLKARKSDIDNTARGSIKPEDFRRLVAARIH